MRSARGTAGGGGGDRDAGILRVHMGAALPPTVFISYSHDSEAHEQRVLGLADQLRANGIDVRLDQYVAHPPEGWPRWCERQAVECTFVIVVCTPTYCQRFDGKDTPGGVGNGVKFEGHILRQMLYEAGTINDKLLPVLFDGDEQRVPLSLGAYTRYRVPAEYDGLYRRLTGQPKTPAGPLGELTVMPPAERPGFGSTASASTSETSGANTSRESETTMTVITDERLVEELANVVVDPEDARKLAKAAGFAPGRIPVFRMPDLFWNAIVEAAGHGAIAGKVQAVADAAAKLFPDNDVFKSYRAKSRP